MKVLVTGGTTGIGRATAHALVRCGAAVMVCGRHQSDLDEALADADGPGEMKGITADLADVAEVARLFREVDRSFDRLDVLVNNAAIGGGAAAETSLEDIDYTVRANLVGYLACAHEAVRRMRDNGGGVVVNVGSMSADVREQGSSVYVATKAGVQGFSEALRKEVNPHGVTVTLIEPGATGTDMQPQSPAEQAELESRGEMLEPDDIAEAVLFCLDRPIRVDVVEMKIRPHHQPI